MVYVCERVAGLPNTGLHPFGNATELSPEIPERDELVRLHRDADAAGALVVHVGVNYSSRAELDAVLRAVRRREVEHVDEDSHRFLLSAHVQAVDLVIRTGGTGA